MSNSISQGYNRQDVSLRDLCLDLQMLISRITLSVPPPDHLNLLRSLVHCFSVDFVQDILLFYANE